MTQNRVIHPKTTPEKLLYGTVRISGERGTGTGFFFHFQLNQTQRVELLLTNKHVIKSTKTASFDLHEGVMKEGVKTPTNNSFNVTVSVDQNIWVPHPDPAVDLGAFLFDPIREREKKTGKEFFNLSFDESLIKSDDLLEAEEDLASDVLMVGYPIGLWDESNNLPIIRRGITASHPALDFNGKSIGVVDIACFPGSSGSPILLSVTGYYDKQGNYQLGAYKNILLGLLSSGPQYTQMGQLEIKEIPTVNSAQYVMNQMIHLGYYVKAKEILTLCVHIKERFNLS